ncbi:MAG: inositol oxygenase [Acidobacteria bacterium]|nr:inositol oxygenase [Acidobacteriota bacterium]
MIDLWDDFVKARYQPERKPEEFRQFTEEAPSVVKDFYRQNHANQTLDFVLGKEREYLPLRKKRMSIWETMEELNKLVDDSDPDTDLSQTEHALQTAESARADGQPRWFVLAAFLHDTGKILSSFGEPQWCVVGDTFPVGCAFSDRIVYHDYFRANPDWSRDELRTECGIYERGCGLRSVHMSWGHDEYLYHVMKPYLPEEALYMLRYHSFYPCHKEGAYQHLMDDHDREMFQWVREFNKYDLYSKSHSKPDTAALMPYYRDLAGEFLPGQIQW